MKILYLVLLLCLVAVAMSDKKKNNKNKKSNNSKGKKNSPKLPKSIKCEGKDRVAFSDFMTLANDMKFPCDFFALNGQRCGKYSITFVPKHVWLANNYYADEYRIYINDTESHEKYEGQTSNKLLLKYHLEGDNHDVFNNTGGEMFPNDIFEIEQRKNGKHGVHFKDKAGTFQFTLIPWHPYDRKKYPHATWAFECFDVQEKYLTNHFPKQMCGALNKSHTIKNVASRWGLQGNHMHNAIYYALFMSDVVQSDHYCAEASQLLKENCGGFDRRMEVLASCSTILERLTHTICVTYFECSPMDTFNACLKWGCEGDKAFDRKHRDLCYAVGKGIDLCGSFTASGNITGYLQSANCYKEYLTIQYTSDEKAQANDTAEEETGEEETGEEETGEEETGEEETGEGAAMNE